MLARDKDEQIHAGKFNMHFFFTFSKHSVRVAERYTTEFLAHFIQNGMQHLEEEVHYGLFIVRLQIIISLVNYNSGADFTCLFGHFYTFMASTLDAT